MLEMYLGVIFQVIERGGESCNVVPRTSAGGWAGCHQLPLLLWSIWCRENTATELRLQSVTVPVDCDIDLPHMQSGSKQEQFSFAP